MNRRNFLKLAGLMGAGAVYTMYTADIRRALAAVTDGSKHVIWLQGAGDSGCTVSLLQGSSPDLVDVINTFRLSTDFNSTLMVPSGDEAYSALQQAADGAVPLDILIVEGAIPAGNYCTIGESGGVPVPVETWVRVLGERATNVVAVGTCASFGGIPAAFPNPTQARSVQSILPDKSVINIPGCPAHPEWVILTLATILSGGTATVDSYGRPRAFFGGDEIHDECPLKDRYYERDIFARAPSEEGCLLKLGCNGPQTRGDCPTRLWNNKTAFCMSGPWVNGVQTINAGAPCIGCTQPGFPDPPFSPFYAAKEED